MAASAAAETMATSAAATTVAATAAFKSVSLFYWANPAATAFQVNIYQVCPPPRSYCANEP